MNASSITVVCENTSTLQGVAAILTIVYDIFAILAILIYAFYKTTKASVSHHERNSSDVFQTMNPTHAAGNGRFAHATH